ncbi:MAG: acetyl-CoA carboxylase biotin carboxyl carrier protein subunit [Microscillaceae bacterium]
MLKVKTQLAYQTEAQAQMTEIERKEGQWWLNGEAQAWDLLTLKPGTYHLVRGEQSYRVELLSANYTEKKFLLRINDQVYETEAQDRFDLLFQRLGMDRHAGAKVSDVKAPMPGLIIEVKAEAGDTVKKGDPLLILEAMKMENIIKAPADGIIKTIKVEKGQNVEKNAVLMVYA